MTALLDRIDVQGITEQAHAARPGRTALTVIAAVLFSLGWVTERAFSVLWLAVTWSWVAVREGWRASRGPSRAARLAGQAAEIHDLRTRLQRFGE